MKTRQMSLLRVLSVMVLLLFAAPMMDGVLTLFQSPHFSETTFFETGAYADHDTTPTSEGETSHLLSTSWEACKKCATAIKEVGKYAVWAAMAIEMEGGVRRYEYQRQQDENRTLQEKPHPIEQCITPPESPPELEPEEEEDEEENDEEDEEENDEENDSECGDDCPYC